MNDRTINLEEHREQVSTRIKETDSSFVQIHFKITENFE